MEADVYALDAERIVRLGKAEHQAQWADRMRLLSLLNAHPLPYAVPCKLEAGTIGGRPYSIEPRLQGATLRAALPGLTEVERQHALRGFLAAIEPLSTIATADLPWGEIVGPDALHCDTWPGFLRQKVRQVLARSRQRLERDVAGLDAAISAFERGVEKLPTSLPKTLVHGDFYPANILVAPDRSISAVLDFGSLTVVGDPDLDRAEALAAVEDPVRDGRSEQEAEWFRSEIVARCSSGVLPRLRLYQLFYALRFSDCGDSDPATYAWCLRLLRSAGARGSVC